MSHHLWNLGVTYALHLYSSLESPWATSNSSQLNFFRYLLRLRSYKRKCVEVGAFQRGWVTFSANLRRRRRRPPTTVGIRKLQ